jgi:hypothetical protein
MGTTSLPSRRRNGIGDEDADDGSRRSSLIGLFVWWIGIGAVASLIVAALVDVVYSRAIYLFVVMPVGGVLLFPAAWAANRWLTPVVSSRIRRS